MPWPAPDEYNEAVQNPRLTLSDTDLKGGSVVCNAMGLPVVSSGAFASVYRIKTRDRDFALRCFLREQKDRNERYRQIADFVCSDSVVATVDFQFVEKGILVSGRWLPVLKMEWVEGVLLNQYIDNHIQSSDKLAALAESFKEAVLSLRSEGAAHGDLQHGNILLRGDELVLIDYDGMFVPSLQGHVSQEIGHPNYQHPKRSHEHFGAYVDNFSSWIIYITLRCLCLDSSLWRGASGEERLLLGRSDFLKPGKSPALNTLLNHKHAEMRGFGELVLELLDHSPEQIPALDEAFDGECKPVFSRLLKRFGMKARAAWSIFSKPKLSVPIVEQAPEPYNRWYDDWQEWFNSPIDQNEAQDSHLPPYARKSAPAGNNARFTVPTLAEWSSYTVEERQKIAFAADSLVLQQILNHPNDKDFEVAVRMLSFRCKQSSSHASMGCVRLSALIVDVNVRDFAKLAMLQSSFEYALCTSLPSDVVPPWISRPYFRALDALIAHKSHGAQVDLYSFLRSWLVLPHSSHGDLHEHLLARLDEPLSSEDFLTNAIKTCQILLELYNDRGNKSSYRELDLALASKLRSLKVDHRYSVYVRAVAAQTLKTLSPA